jgi:hypothetical protein
LKVYRLPIVAARSDEAGFVPGDLSIAPGE